MKKSTYNVPSIVSHPKNNAVMNTDALNNAVMNTNVMNGSYLYKSHQVHKKLQYKVKTSSDADATQGR